MFSKENQLEGRKFVTLLNYLYRLIYDRLYLGIYKILENKRKDVVSLKNFYKKIGCDSVWKDVERHNVYSRIRTKRNDQLAHDNRELAFDQNKATAHHEDNKLRLQEIEEFLEFVKYGFEQAVAGKGRPIVHYALGDELEVKELKDLLIIAFSEGS